MCPTCEIDKLPETPDKYQKVAAQDSVVTLLAIEDEDKFMEYVNDDEKEIDYDTPIMPATRAAAIVCAQCQKSGDCEVKFE